MSSNDTRTEVAQLAEVGQEIARVIVETLVDTDFRDTEMSRVFLVNFTEAEPMMLVGALLSQTRLFGEMMRAKLPPAEEGTEVTLGFELAVDPKDPNAEDVERWLSRAMTLLTSYAEGDYKKVASILGRIVREYHQHGESNDPLIIELLETWSAQQHIASQLHNSEADWVRVDREVFEKYKDAGLEGLEEALRQSQQAR